MCGALQSTVLNVPLETLLVFPDGWLDIQILWHSQENPALWFTVPSTAITRNPPNKAQESLHCRASVSLLDGIADLSPVLPLALRASVIDDLHGGTRQYLPTLTPGFT